ncbi:CCA-adding enzyme [Salpingoeca rosetta]|uniref:CCA-adding enzyme n=1 Tax=Salpingoeca rosetta (strain ATCC 50818 / BSB-021) TaxID=946362 RepID=F2USA7_SALR5|nr:CCA-adding enzyme [Salpingoeca rosetta]EGD81016.1 CCA-adding enzyme [Salpingoeca rosetta]|eukprot:XP_004987886.1 CCA-adding enzyme [Salpingoeca rosetta]
MLLGRVACAAVLGGVSGGGCCARSVSCCCCCWSVGAATRGRPWRRPVLQLTRRNLQPTMPTSQEVKQKILGTPAVQQLKHIFQEDHHEFRLVGGAVRDILLERWPKDYDFATTALPQQTQQLLESRGVRVVLTGLQHGTVTAVIDNVPYEVTTLRLDHEGAEGTGPVCFTDDWKLDAERRDLTINAMSMDLDGHIFDYFDGRDHLAQEKIVFVGDPAQRIQEDFLRILRYFRFHGKVCRHNNHEPAQIQAITDNVQGLESVSGERIWMEMSKILKTARAPELVECMQACGVLPHIQLANVEQHHLQRLRHVHRYELEPATALTALVDDVQQFEGVAAAWRLSNAERKLGLFIIQHRDVDVCMNSAQDLLVDGINRTYVTQLCRYQGHLDIAVAMQDWAVPEFPITGKKLIQHGLKPGPNMGRVLAALKDNWKQSRFQLGEEELLAQMDSVVASLS